MSAQHIFDTAPLGAMIRFTDGNPRPPDRFRRKLSQWKDRNNGGRLVEKCTGRGTGTRDYPATFTLHMATYGSNGTAVLVVNRTFTVASDLAFEIVEWPRPGMVRVLTAFLGSTTLRHLAPDMGAARAWLAEHHYQDAWFEVVIDDEIQGRGGINPPDPIVASSVAPDDVLPEQASYAFPRRIAARRRNLRGKEAGAG